MIDLLVTNVDMLSALCCIVGFTFGWFRAHGAQPKKGLDWIVPKAFAASAIPTGVLLLVCAFKPAVIAQLTGLNIYIAAAGLVLIYISWTTVRE